MRYQWKIRLWLWAGLLVVVVFLVWQSVVPTGCIVYERRFPGDDFFVENLEPEDRVGSTEKGIALAVGDPVYFNLRTPRKFNQARLELTYRRSGQAANDPESLPIVSLGVLADAKAWRYRLKPIENYYLDNLSSDWSCVKEDNLMLFQRKNKYESLEALFTDPPASERIAVYEAKLDMPYRFEGYQTATSTRELPVFLRGGYEFLTYIKDEALELEFAFQDLNQNNETDPVSVQLYFKENLLDDWVLPDDGIASGSGLATEIRELAVFEPGLPEGVYKLIVRANDDIITQELAYRHLYLSFPGSVRLYQTGREDIHVFTTSPRLQVKTVHPDSRQIIDFAGSKLALTETYRQFEAESATSAPEYVIGLERDGVTLSGNGNFAFRPDELFDPSLRKVDRNFSRFIKETDFILTEYEPQDRQYGEWTQATQVFDLTQASRHESRYGFILSVPGLRADDNIADGIEIKKISVELAGKNIWQKIKELFL
jgi:hypothetical protein